MTFFPQGGGGGGGGGAAVWGSITGIVTDQTDLKTGLLNASGDAPIYACRAWVNFKGTETVAIRAAGNVSSITDNGVGFYTVNFTTAMPDTNYAIVSGAGSNHIYLNGFTKTTSAADLVSGYPNSLTRGVQVADSLDVFIAVFR